MVSKDLQRINELYQIGGIKEVYRGIRDRSIIFLGLSENVDYAERRVDNRDRWDFMKPCFNGIDMAIDIGCAEGYFTRKLAKQGIFSVGIDNNAERVEKALAASDGQDGCGFMNWELRPDNIGQLPKADVILLLTVHHHWVRHYGLEDAERMFQTVMDRADTVLYEPPGDRALRDSEKIDPEDSVAFYIDRLKELYGESIDIIEYSMFDYKKDPEDRLANVNTRKDPIFVLNTTSFEKPK